MKILRREEIWIHTHFVTDCVYLPDHYVREIRRQAARLLEQSGLVFGLHFDGRGEGGLRLVLECIPLPATMSRIEQGLKEIVAPIPARPRQTETTIEPPRRGRAIERAR